MRLSLLLSLSLLLTACAESPAPAGDPPADTPEAGLAADAYDSELDYDPHSEPFDVTEMAFLGAWACEEGFAPAVVFEQEGGDSLFAAFQDDRLITSGSWSWDGETLAIRSPAGDFTFTEVHADENGLVLGSGEERWACVYTGSEF